mmetsp:Transcript_3341/g.13351  ORF Transcript_3341/g.13351 Transcript_3341/m.13351 type:complete len:204 (-) Transcript_3341:79-690(-)
MNRNQFPQLGGLVAQRFLLCFVRSRCLLHPLLNAPRDLELQQPLVALQNLWHLVRPEKLLPAQQVLHLRHLAVVCKLIVGPVVPELEDRVLHLLAVLVDIRHAHEPLAQRFIFLLQLEGLCFTLPSQLLQLRRRLAVLLVLLGLQSLQLQLQRLFGRQLHRQGALAILQHPIHMLVQLFERLVQVVDLPVQLAQVLMLILVCS